MENFDYNCEKATMFATCAQSSLKSCGIDSAKVDKCMKASLIKTKDDPMATDMLDNF